MSKHKLSEIHDRFETPIKLMAEKIDELEDDLDIINYSESEMPRYHLGIESAFSHLIETGHYSGQNKMENLLFATFHCLNAINILSKEND